MNNNPTVKELIIYPVKSCAGIKVQEALSTRYGLSLPSNPCLSDRRWMVVKNGRQLTQRQQPKMALIQPSFVSDGLILKAPGIKDLKISMNPPPKEIIECICWDAKINGKKYDIDVSNWLSTFLETPDLDLVYFDDQFEGRICKDIIDPPNSARDYDVASYHDESPFHLDTMESFNDLNQRLKTPITIYNFRPNIIVQNVQAPYAEDYWRQIQIGGAIMTWVTQCRRCLLPTVNQQTGITDPEQEPWKTLRSYRLKPEVYGVKAMFGLNLAPDIHGILHVGDEVKILKVDNNF